MTSNERSFPWDDYNGDREYSSDEFAEFFSTLFKPGVVATANFGTGLQITESASLGMRVKFGSGEAFSSFGRNYVHDQDEEVIVPIASTLQDRTDSVAIQFNKSQREAFFVYKESDVTVTRTDSIFELQIAKILVPKNSTQITNANITDMRADESVCGYFSPHGKLNTGDITAQFNVQFESWFNTIKGQLSEDAAGNLQLQITDLDSRAVHKTTDETIDGNKTFSGDTSLNNVLIGGNLTERTTAITIPGFYTLTITLRRTGNDVELISSRNTISSAVGHEQTDAGFTIPSGFRPISRALAKVEMNNSTTLYNPMILRLDSDGKIYLTNEAFSNNRYAQCYATWKTNNSWPT